MAVISTTPEDTPFDPRAPEETRSLDRHGYLFGLKLKNSWSPFLHDVIYQNLGLPWGQVRLDSADMDLFLTLAQHPKFYGAFPIFCFPGTGPACSAVTWWAQADGKGASVTMPNKVAILPHLDEMTPECRDVGACNTLYIRQDPLTGRRLLCGAQTDVIGIRDSFVYNVPHMEATVHGKPALVVGGGGAARSAVYALRKWMKVTEIYLVNRDEEEVDAVIKDSRDRGYGEGLVPVTTSQEAENLSAPGAIVACVPDFEPVTEEEKRARAVTETFLGNGKGAMLEMCYNPTPWTRLGKRAEEQGWQVILGTEAMIWQGIEQDRYWTGRQVTELPVVEVKTAVKARIEELLTANGSRKKA